MRIALKVLKWAGIVLGGLIALIIIAVVVVWFVVGGRLSKTYDVQPATVAIPADAPSEASGWPLFLVEVACQECHGENLGGDVMSDDPVFGRLVARNLTSGNGGIGGSYTDTDWVRSVRHGVDPDGKSLVLMPSHEFYKLGDADLGQIHRLRQEPLAGGQRDAFHCSGTAGSDSHPGGIGVPARHRHRS